MRDVMVVGTGITPFGELWEHSLRDLGIRAGMEAIRDAGITSSDIDALFVGNMAAGRLIDQTHIGALIADFAGLAGRNLPTVTIEGADASGAAALHHAYLSVASGLHDCVVVGGAEKMTDLPDPEVTEITATALDQQWESFFGATLFSMYAMMARRHMHEFGTTREQLARVAVKNHRNGALNPAAQFRRPVRPESVLEAAEVADPLGMLDCAPISDGAAAVVLCSAERARRLPGPQVRIAASAQAGDTLSLSSRRSLVGFDATSVAMERALKLAGRSRKEVDFAEVHDVTTISEIMAIEDLGFVKKGAGGPATASGMTAPGGELPVNTSGGLKARGHPLGATGIAQIIELVLQLQGKAEERQVPEARVGLAHNVGGCGATAFVHILEVA
ncbi:MAG: thiolase domain-containing protein [Euryarchaeota archaeon]|nr:thiolase domain-containing protein [Euryarchaeota archaeon]